MLAPKQKRIGRTTSTLGHRDTRQNLRIVHKSGKLHADADALSRYEEKVVIRMSRGEDEIEEVNDNYVPLCSTVPIKRGSIYA